MKLLVLDPSTWFKKISESKHEAVVLGFSTGMRPRYWQSWHSENAHKPRTNNITNTDDPELDKLIDQYRNSLEEEERIRHSLQIQEMIHEIGDGALGLCIIGRTDMKYVGAKWCSQRLGTGKKAESGYTGFVDDINNLYRGWSADVIKQHEYLVVRDQFAGIGNGLFGFVSIVIGQEFDFPAVDAARSVDFVEPRFTAKCVLATQKTSVSTQRR